VAAAGTCWCETDAGFSVPRVGWFDSFDFVAKRRHRKRTGGRTTPKGTRPVDSRHRRQGDDDLGPVPELVAGIRPLLAAPTPFELMVQASGFVEIATERPMDGLGPEQMRRVDGPEFVGSLVDSGWPELIVLGKAMATLLPDSAVVRRLRTQALPSDAPGWASTMDTIEITGTFVQSEPLGDGENMWVCVRWPHGSEATAVLFVDHNMGTVLKDAFLIPAGAEDVMAMMRDVSDDVIDLAPIDPADLRARVTWSIERGDHTPARTETAATAWLTSPQCSAYSSRDLRDRAERSVPTTRTTIPTAKRNQPATSVSNPSRRKTSPSPAAPSERAVRTYESTVRSMDSLVRSNASSSPRVSPRSSVTSIPVLRDSPRVGHLVMMARSG